MPPATVLALKPFWIKDPRRVVGALTRAADDEDLAVAGELVQTPAKLVHRDVDHSLQLLHRELLRVAHIQEEAVSEGIPLGEADVAAQEAPPATPPTMMTFMLKPSR